MDVNGKFTMNDMSAVDKFIGMAKKSLPSSFPDNLTGKLMQEVINIFGDMLDIQRRIAIQEAECSADQEAAYYDRESLDAK